MQSIVVDNSKSGRSVLDCWRQSGQHYTTLLLLFLLYQYDVNTSNNLRIIWQNCRTVEWFSSICSIIAFILTLLTWKYSYNIEFSRELQYDVLGLFTEHSRCIQMVQRHLKAIHNEYWFKIKHRKFMGNGYLQGRQLCQDIFFPFRLDPVVKWA